MEGPGHGLARAGLAPGLVGRRDQQHAGGTASDRGLRQRHVDRRNPHPDKRQEKPIDNEDDDGRGDPPGQHAPGTDAQNKQCQRRIEDLFRHRRGSLVRIAPPMSCVTMAPESCTRSQVQNSFAPVSHPNLGNQAKHDQAQSEIVDLREGMKPCQLIGKAQQADGSRHEENGPAKDAGNAEEIKHRARLHPAPRHARPSSRSLWMRRPQGSPA